MDTLRIERYRDGLAEALVALSIRAWEPVFESIRGTMEAEVYQAFYREGWRKAQEQAVLTVCGDGEMSVWVAWAEESVAGFVAVRLHRSDRIGEVYMVAVDPEFQSEGIGSALTEYALQWMQAKGMEVAMVETGGDDGHAPARRTYEKLGFALWPVARYFKKL